MVQIPDDKLVEGVWETAKALISGGVVLFARSLRAWVRGTLERIDLLEKRVKRLQRELGVDPNDD